MSAPHATILAVLDIADLELVCAVADERSLTRAAERLNVTQSALSHRLKEAERQLRRSLFVRSRAGMDPTPAGRRLLETARRITGELGATEKEILSSTPAAEGPLRIATECYTCYHWLPAALSAFRRRFPTVEVDVVVEATRAPVPALLAGKIDLAIVSDPVRNRKIAVEPLFRDELVVAMAPSHRLSRASHVEASDFAGETLITYRVEKKDLTVYERVLKPAGVAPARWIKMELTEAILELVKAGQGITVLSGWAAEPAVRSGEIVVRPLTRSRIARQWSAATMRRQSRSAHLAEFVSVLASAPTRRRQGFAVAL